ncbi:hypothetical protein RMHFA_05594 (plasmid) [Roseomonas mucosa]|nr:hypothetical protein RMP42_05594 [Roseomonas mucosa]UZO99480.1 hypothetical protein RMHFA_05594 [Roseomonas mucosa]
MTERADCCAFSHGLPALANRPGLVSGLTGNAFRRCRSWRRTTIRLRHGDREG